MKSICRFGLLLLPLLLSQPSLFGETLFGKEGWTLFYTDGEGTKFYWPGQDTTMNGNHRVKYVSVYKAPKEYNLIYGYAAEVEIQCGIFKRAKPLSLQPFGKGGPDNLLLNPTPAAKDFSLVQRDTAYYALSQQVCK